jgi:hypothetical protein
MKKLLVSATENIHGLNNAYSWTIHKPSPLRLKSLLWCWKDVNHQLLIKFWQKWSEEVKHYGLRSTNLIPFEVRKKYHSNGRNLLLFRCTTCHYSPTGRV